MNGDDGNKGEEATMSLNGYSTKVFGTVFRFMSLLRQDLACISGQQVPVLLWCRWLQYDKLPELSESGSKPVESARATFFCDGYARATHLEESAELREHCAKLQLGTAT